MVIFIFFEKIWQTRYDILRHGGKVELYPGPQDPQNPRESRNSWDSRDLFQPPGLLRIPRNPWDPENLLGPPWCDA